MEKKDFVELSKLFDSATTEQLYFVQQYVDALIKEKINKAAVASGLVEQTE